MTKYTVTTELDTPWYRTALRFLGFRQKRKEFVIQFSEALFEKGDILGYGIEKTSIKVLKRHGRR